MKIRTKLLLSSVIALLTAGNVVSVMAQSIPVRNDVPRVGQQEVIMMRHAYLEEGQYEYWQQQSEVGVWPWFERLGSRIIGDFEVIYPKGEDESPGQDEALRFARYASYKHWQSTRGAVDNPTGGSVVLAGSGGLSQASSDALRNRRTVMEGSKEAVFLMGYMAETRPIFTPGTGEAFAVTTDPGDDAPHPVALMAAEPKKPDEEIMELRYQRIKKVSFEEFHAITKNGTWPYLEKIGVRPIGQWKVAYLPTGTPVESEDYDEMYTLSRYASIEHYDAVNSGPADLGGDGPDYQAAIQARRKLVDLAIYTSNRYLRGPLFGSPPVYAKPIDAKYQLVD